MKSEGIVGVFQNRATLENRIRLRIADLPSLEDLSEIFIDPRDRTNVHRRALIAATLQAIFEHSMPKEGCDGIVEFSNDPMNELANARLDFIHDLKRLDNGFKGELIAAPVNRDSIESTRQISARRKELITWLAVFALYDEDKPSQFPIKSGIRSVAARAMGKPVASLKTEEMKLKKQDAKKSGEKALLEEITKQARDFAHNSNGAHTAFGLLLPAALALSNV